MPGIKAWAVFPFLAIGYNVKLLEKNKFHPSFLPVECYDRLNDVDFEYHPSCFSR